MSRSRSPPSGRCSRRRRRRAPAKKTTRRRSEPDTPAMNRSEIADGMRIEWDVPIPMDDGVVLRADVFRPIDDGRYPVDPELRPLRQGRRVPGRISSAAWDKMVARLSGDGARHDQQVRGVRGGRSGEMGAGRLRGACASTAAAPAARRASRSEVDPRDQGPVRMHRMGGAPALVQRQGRPQRHLLLRDQPVVRRLAASRRISPRSACGKGRATIIARTPTTAASSATSSSRCIRGRCGACSTASASAARRARSPASRRAGPRRCRDDELDPQPARRRSLAAVASARRRLLPRPLGRNGTRSTVPLLTAANWGGHGLHPRGNFEGFVRAASRRNGSKRTATPTGRISTPTTASRCRSASSTISSRARTPAGTGSRAVQLQVRHVDRFVERHENEWPLARTQWTKFYLDRRRAHARARAAVAGAVAHLRSAGRRPDVPHRRRSPRRPRSPGRWRPSCSSRPRAAMPTSSWCCACSRRTAGRCISRAPTIRTRRSRSAGCAPRIASSIRR